MLASGTRLGPYEVVAPIGAGGMGEVYKGRDTRLDRSVAIKVLPAHLSADPDLKLRFKREARVISSLNHPNICTLHDVGKHDDIDYLVMELCDGQTLLDRLAKGPLPIEQVFRIAIQIADALDRAHRAGIVHRDLKPGNIILSRSGAKLLDFGLAKPVFDDESGRSATGEDLTQQKPLTAAGAIVGTYQYMSPEQLQGREVDARTDIFALGAVLYEMISGRRAFDGTSRASVIAAIIEREPEPLSVIQPLIPPELDRVVTTCLAKDADERWQNAHDLKRELEWIRDGVSSPLRTAVRPRRMNRERLAWGLAVLLPLVAIIGTWALVRAGAAPARRLVAAIAPPIGTAFIVTGDVAGPVTLSPDGRRTVYVASANGKQALWVTSLETGLAKQLPGTDGAMFPFWSPNSRSIGFFASAKLMITDIEGAPPRVVAEAPDARGGAWGPDDHIIFTPFTQTGLFRVSASGGPVTPVTQARGQYTTHRWPAFMPDGKRLTYLAASHASPGSQDTAIFIASLDGKENRKLIHSPGNGIPYHDYLLYLQANKLVAQRLEKGELRGEPITVWDGVLYDPGTWRSIFSVSSSGLLATHSTSSYSGTRAIWLDRKGVEIGELQPPAVLGDIALSPQGDKIALSVGDPRGIIYIDDLRRGVRTRFSFIESPANNPLWTPDGKTLIFSTVRDGIYRIFAKPVDGSANERVLLESPLQSQPIDVTPDGRFLIFNQGSGASLDVAALPLAGGKPFIVAGGPAQQSEGRVSPDARWLLHINVDDSGRLPFLTPFPGPGGKWQVANESAYRLWWGRDGKEIYFLAGDGVKSVPVSFEENSVQVGTAVSLFPLSVNTNRHSVAMTADGSRFLAVVTRAQDSGAATLVSEFDLELK